MQTIINSWKSPVVLAPMAGVTDRVFRRICRAHKSGAAYTPMVSAKSVLYDNRTAFDLMQTDQGEENLALQLFGHEAEDIAAAIEHIDLTPYTWLDINMGCPAPKIVRQGEGSALMLDLPNAEKIIRAAVKVSPIPVSVKVRKGWDDDHINAVEFARMAQDAGAAMICVHPRTQRQMYTGKADLDMLQAVIDAVEIPVIASGDVKDGASAKRALDMGAAAVMIGRASFGDPWLSARIDSYLKTGEELPSPTQQERLCTSVAHARMLVEDLPERVAMLQMRKHVAWYIHGIAGAGKMRAAVNDTTRLCDLEECISSFACEAIGISRDAFFDCVDDVYANIMQNAAANARSI